MNAATVCETLGIKVEANILTNGHTDPYYLALTVPKECKAVLDAVVLRFSHAGFSPFDPQNPPSVYTVLVAKPEFETVDFPLTGA